MVVDFNKNCKGKSICNFDPTQYLLPDDELASDYPRQCR